MKQVVILGAGTGGALIANMLSHLLNLKEWVITIVDRQYRFRSSSCFWFSVAGWFLLARTKFGAHLYGVGGNSEVARLSGVRTDRILIGAHMICSMTAVLAGIFLVSQMRSGAPWVGPNGLYDLNSIATAVIGGTALSGGKGGVWGTLAGVLIFGILDTTFNQLGVNPYLKMVLRGAIIVLAVASYTIRSKKEAA